jgi:predicted nucleotidyltransferase component of viral defense system
LEYLNTNPILKETLALKGGTAINLTIFNLPRLSVDIDEKLAQTRDFSRELASEVKTRQYLEYQHISSYNYHKTPIIMALALYIC